MMALGILGWALTVPGALAGLALPLAIVLLSFRRRRPQLVALGTARLLEDRGEAAASRRRWRLSGSRLWAVVALLLGILAAARPRPAAEDGAAYVLTIYVDRSPSMFLPVDPDAPGGERRIERALGAATAWLAALNPATERAVVRWRALEDGGLDVTLDAEDGCPEELLRAPSRVLVSPRWGRLVAPGVIFVTDTGLAPSALESSGVGLFASGGPAVPGPVAAGGEGLLIWSGEDGAPLQAGPKGEPLRVVFNEALAAPLRSLGALWAEERGLAVGGDRRGAALILQPGDEATEGAAAGRGSLTAGRDGWSAAIGGRLDLRDGGAQGWSPWLVGEDGECLVRARRGEVEVGFTEILPEPASVEAFAVSWARLLDEHLAPPEVVVALEERRAAGPAVSHEPALEGALEPEVLSRRARRASRGRMAELLLSAGAAVAGLLALGLRLRGSA
ncbi:hypothetical protein N9Z54_02465 [Planctomycetota bacterium]|nr:hypothetical protein [Planctomycetota bacterium]